MVYTGVSYVIPKGKYFIAAATLEYGSYRPYMVAICWSNTSYSALSTAQTVSDDKSRSPQAVYLNKASENSNTYLYVWGRNFGGTNTARLRIIYWG